MLEFKLVQFPVLDRASPKTGPERSQIFFGPAPVHAQHFKRVNAQSSRLHHLSLLRKEQLPYSVKHAAVIGTTVDQMIASSFTL